jgi:hypothetical protein
MRIFRLDLNMPKERDMMRRSATRDPLLDKRQIIHLLMAVIALTPQLANLQKIEVVELGDAGSLAREVTSTSGRLHGLHGFWTNWSFHENSEKAESWWKRAPGPRLEAASYHKHPSFDQLRRAWRIDSYVSMWYWCDPMHRSVDNMVNVVINEADIKEFSPTDSRWKIHHNGKVLKLPVAVAYDQVVTRLVKKGNSPISRLVPATAQ